SVTDITVNPGGGTNIIGIKSIASGNPTTINGSTGTSSVILSSTVGLTGNVAGIQSVITVHAGTDTRLYAVDYNGTSRPNTVMIHSNGITGLALNPIMYTGMLSLLRVIGSNSTTLAESYEVNAPPATSLRLDSNSGPDTVTVTGNTTGDIYL